GELMPTSRSISSWFRRRCICKSPSQTEQSDDSHGGSVAPTSHAFSSDNLVGKALFGNFKILDKLGEGATGIVYKAFDLSFDKLVAIKTIKTKNPEILARFAKEVRTHAKLRHENIVDPVVCLDDEQGQPFFIMEFLDGLSLEALLKTFGRLDREDEVASVVLQVCDALHYAHEKKVIHRDLTPANILIQRKEDELVAKVADFGLAKLEEDLQRLTHDGVVMGSPLYMSPEQCKGERLSTRSDIYSLGLIIYEMVTGEAAYEKDSNTVFELMSKHCNKNVFPAPPTQICPDFKNIEGLEKVIWKAVATNPEIRYQTVQELKRDLLEWRESAFPSETEEEEQESIEVEGVFFVEPIDEYNSTGSEWIEELYSHMAAAGIDVSAGLEDNVGRRRRSRKQDKKSK
ncbi:MAG: serine/threonine protein kinase, partial [Cyanobacteria bacterium]|nr:serine/threonine protein kinase [Cyanobacteriota bacterium]